MSGMPLPERYDRRGIRQGWEIARKDDAVTVHMDSQLQASVDFHGTSAWIANVLVKLGTWVPRVLTDCQGQ